ncbi:MAG TPA: hypothetical protein VI819_05415 [Patescibacteria group bacterium]|nr:hypothetical protein [Patescibacteria group bacterium]
MVLTKKDLDERLDAFELKLDQIISEKLDEQERRFGGKLDEQERKFGSKLDEQEEKFEEKLIEFKSEFFTKIDPILKEVVTAREERPLILNRIEKIEKKLHIQAV